MSDFKAGDKIRIKSCASPFWWYSRLVGKVYTLRSKSSYGWSLEEVSCADEDYYIFSENDLELVEEEALVLEEHPLESYPVKDNPAKQSALETRKDDKNMMHLVDTGFPNALLALGEVMSWAARNKGYLPNDWKDIPEPFNAFLGAASRHRNKRLAGDDRDDESGLYHLAHEAFNVLAQLELKMLGKLDD